MLHDRKVLLDLHMYAHMRVVMQTPNPPASQHGKADLQREVARTRVCVYSLVLYAGQVQPTDSSWGRRGIYKCRVVVPTGEL